jgi:hypothetical protein
MSRVGIDRASGPVRFLFQDERKALFQVVTALLMVERQRADPETHDRLRCATECFRDEKRPRGSGGLAKTACSFSPLIRCRKARVFWAAARGGLGPRASSSPSASSTAAMASAIRPSMRSMTAIRERLLPATRRSPPFFANGHRLLVTADRLRAVRVLFVGGAQGGIEGGRSLGRKLVTVSDGQLPQRSGSAQHAGRLCAASAAAGA